MQVKFKRDYSLPTLGAEDIDCRLWWQLDLLFGCFLATAMTVAIALGKLLVECWVRISRRWDYIKTVNSDGVTSVNSPFGFDGLSRSLVWMSCHVHVLVSWIRICAKL